MTLQKTSAQIFEKGQALTYPQTRGHEGKIFVSDED
jgi:hypothetical protein